jgi:hypothetical protein
MIIGARIGSAFLKALALVHQSLAGLIEIDTTNPGRPAVIMPARMRFQFDIEDSRLHFQGVSVSCALINWAIFVCDSRFLFLHLEIPTICITAEMARHAIMVKMVLRHMNRSCVLVTKKWTAVRPRLSIAASTIMSQRIIR